MTEIGNETAGANRNKEVMKWGEIKCECADVHDKYIKKVDHRRCDGGCNNIDEVLESKR